MYLQPSSENFNVKNFCQALTGIKRNSPYFNSKNMTQKSYAHSYLRPLWSNNEKGIKRFHKSITCILYRKSLDFLVFLGQMWQYLRASWVLFSRLERDTSCIFLIEKSINNSKNIYKNFLLAQSLFVCTICEFF